jgi:hypothetical protein
MMKRYKRATSPMRDQNLDARGRNSLWAEGREANPCADLVPPFPVHKDMEAKHQCRRLTQSARPVGPSGLII